MTHVPSVHLLHYCAVHSDLKLVHGTHWYNIDSTINLIQIKPWKLETDDTVLLDLLPFLEAVWSTNVSDVRDVVRSYQGQDIPVAFRSGTL